ncbi:hypothetical protein LINPERHAP2_LOCUS18468 [Linum perenne]
MDIAATVGALHRFPPPLTAEERQLSIIGGDSHTWHKTPTILEQPKLNKQSGSTSESGSNPITKPKFSAFTFPNVILNPNSDTQMKPTKRRGRPSSPARSARPAAEFPSSDASAASPRRRTPAASLVEGELASNRDTFALFQDLRISEEYVSSGPEPRSFPNSVKLQCWEKAEKVKGRDPARWRRDPLGNIVFRKLVGCPGCLCHDYDHIVPYSKGGKSTLENCQVLQVTANRSKGNRTELSRAELISRSNYCRVSEFFLIVQFAGRDMDLVESLSYGNVQHSKDSGGCRIQ